MRRITLLTSAAFAFFCLILSGMIQAGVVPVDFSGQRMQVYCASDAPGYYEAKVYFCRLLERLSTATSMPTQASSGAR